MERMWRRYKLQDTSRKWMMIVLFTLLVICCTACGISDAPYPDDREMSVETPESTDPEDVITQTYSFRNEKLLDQHYKKHGIEMGFVSAEAYQAAASAVINDPQALYKTEAEDGDGVYYIVDTNEFVILSTDGYIRTYFNPRDGIDYFNRQ